MILVTNLKTGNISLILVAYSPTVDTIANVCNQFAGRKNDRKLGDKLILHGLQIFITRVKYFMSLAKLM